MKLIKPLLILLSISLLGTMDVRGMKLTSGKRANAAIYLSPDASNAEITAAKKLQYHLTLATGAILDINMSEPKGRGGCIFIRAYKGADAVEGSYQVKSLDNNTIEIIGVGRGILYGVYNLLEHIGFRMYANEELDFPYHLFSGVEVKLPISNSWAPHIGYATIYSDATNNEDFAMWHKFNYDHNHARSGWANWGASYFDLVSPQKYFESNPQYFSLRDGVRVAQQLCLSNLDVLQIVTEELEKLMKANPTATYFSVSPELNQNFCQCSECAIMDEVDNSSIGSVVQFADIMAQTFSNKRIGLFVDVNRLSAPKSTMVSDNLTVVLSSTYGDYSKPIAVDDSHAVLRRDIEEWKMAAKSVMIWEHIASALAANLPFMNLMAMGDNLKYYYDKGVRSFCFDATNQKDVYMGEMKSYLLARLLSNPSLSAEDLLKDYCQGYYGAAGTYVLEFIKTMEAKLSESGGGLYLYGSVEDATSGWLNPSNVAELNGILQVAKKAVAGDTKLQARVDKLTIRL